jgi:hypothetical protein
MVQHKYHDALRVALRLNEPATIESTFAACSDVLERRQLGYLLARHGAWGAINLEEGPAAVEVRRCSFRCRLQLFLPGSCSSLMHRCAKGWRGMVLGAPPT